MPVIQARGTLKLLLWPVRLSFQTMMDQSFTFQTIETNSVVIVADTDQNFLFFANDLGMSVVFGRLDAVMLDERVS